ncbi:hypothetical protein FRB94_010925 [Tulasnella sp. JGI-2019a]|nr:hypothetical protein FRB94_010925 [Tulasnella sp. JGI-2019a]KAG9013986.1 hypothetical protein FRB93_000367 [Tulasnella sp. JGI-2019a]
MVSYVDAFRKASIKTAKDLQQLRDMEVGDQREFMLRMEELSGMTIKEGLMFRAALRKFTLDL